MSKISEAAHKMHENATLRTEETVKNFMGGDSYKLDPMATLRMVTASSILGDVQYYRNNSSLKKGNTSKTTLFHGIYTMKANIIELLNEHNVIGMEITQGSILPGSEDVVGYMEKVIDDALDYDFGATLKWATVLRNQYYVRLNPNVIMVRAAIHSKRKGFTSENPKAFDTCNREVMVRADDCLCQMAYYLYKNNGKKNNIPSILKRSWAHRLQSIGRYQMAKYKNAEIGMINGVRITHASSPVIDELMRTGAVAIKEDENTWENLRSGGMAWADIFKKIDMGHMALLRNLRNFLKEVEDTELIKEYLNKLKGGVLTGKQFAYRYWSAYKAIEKAAKTDGQIHHVALALDALEECMDICIANMPHLKGTTVCLSDNSGSAWDGITTEYGTTTIAEIDNLSSVITAMCSDEGYVIKFGDTMKTYTISKHGGVLRQTRDICQGRCDDVGGGTEGGIWEFFYKAMQNKTHYDNIFIYSDQQAGVGTLYGDSKQLDRYSKLGYGLGRMINVFKLILDYRKKVNSKVNVFSIQTAGYDNMVLPNYAYRTNLLYGWTGREATFAGEIIKMWDVEDEKKQHKKANK